MIEFGILILMPQVKKTIILNNLTSRNVKQEVLKCLLTETFLKGLWSKSLLLLYETAIHFVFVLNVTVAFVCWIV